MYKAMYLHLFNACTDALRALEVRNIWEAQRILTEAQCAAGKAGGSLRFLEKLPKANKCP